MCEPQETNSYSKICLLVLCGLPGSGKSRLAKLLVENSKLSTQRNTDNPASCLRFVHIEYDELLPPDVEKHILAARQEDDYEESLWKRYRYDILTCVDSLVNYMEKKRAEEHHDVSVVDILDVASRPEAVSQDLWQRFIAVAHRITCTVSEGDTICFIIDDNMYYRSMRYKFYQLARKYTIGFCQCCLVIPVDLAVSRNSKRPIMVDENVIRTMEARLEVPDGDSHSWERFSVVCTESAPGDYIDQVTDLVRRASTSPILALEEVDLESRDLSREICSTSLHHQVDQIIRRIISKEITHAKEKGDNTTDLKQLASYLQVKRKKILQDLKSGYQLVPRDLNISKNDSKDTESRLFEFVQEIFTGSDLT